MNLRFPDIQIHKEAIVPALFLTSSILFFLLGDPTFSLNKITNLYISQATKKGVDISARVNYFYQILLVAAFVFPVLYGALTWLCKKADPNRKEIEALQVTAFTGICLIFTDIIGIECSTVVLLFLAFSLGITGYLLAISFSPYLKNMRLHLFRLYPFLVLMALIGVTAISFLLNSTSVSAWLYILLLVVLPVPLFTIFLWLKSQFGWFIRQFCTAVIPIAFIPVFLFVSIELLIYSKEVYDTFIPWKWVFIILTGSTFFLFLPFVVKQSVSLSTTKVLRYFLLPASLLSFVLCTQYSPVIDQPTDLFELANPANAQMRIFKFGEWPLVDFMSSHLLNEQFYGIIYHAIFGYEGSLDFLTYEFLQQLVFLAIVFWFLFKLLGNGPLALLMIVTFPFLWYFFNKAVFPSILAFIMVRKVTNKQIWQHYFFLFIALAVLVLWRIDTGVSAIFASLFFLPISYFTERISIRVRPLFKGMGLFLLFIILMVAPFVLIKGPSDILFSFMNMYHYIAGSQAHGYASLAYEHPQQFYLYYVAFPAIAFLFVLYIIHALRNRIHFEDLLARFSLSAALFLFLAYFGNFQRGLVRHSFVENIDAYVASTFFLAISLTVLPYLQPSRSAWRYIYFFGLGFGLIVLLKYHPLDKGPTDMERFLVSPTITDIDYEFTDKHYQGRVRQDNHFAQNNYKDVKAFLDRNLSARQTFLDFSNTPMLYFYCQRAIPSYFCQNLQNSIDDFLQKAHLEKIKSPSRVPIVIYSNYPPNWWDKTDGVPNAMRYYFITAFIHDNYEPYGVIDNRRIWVKKGWRPEGQFERPDTLSLNPKSYHYEKSAGFLASYLINRADKRLEKVGETKPEREGKAQFRASIPNNLNGDPAVLAKIEVSDVRPDQKITMELTNEDGSLGRSSFVTMEGKEDYILPLFVHYSWQHAHVTNLQLTGDENFTIQKLSLFSDKGYEP